MLSFINIEANNMRKNPVLQLKQSNSHLSLYLLNEQIVLEKQLVGTRATDSIIKSGQKDTEASILKQVHCIAFVKKIVSI